MPTRATITFDASGRLCLHPTARSMLEPIPERYRRVDAGEWQPVALATARVAYDAVGKRLIGRRAGQWRHNSVRLEISLWNATHGADGINAFVNDVTLAGAGQTAFYGNTQIFGFYGSDRFGCAGQPNQSEYRLASNLEPPSPAMESLVARRSLASWFSSPWVNNRVDPTRMALGGTTSTSLRTR